MRSEVSVFAVELRRRCVWQPQHSGRQGGTETDSPCVWRKAVSRSAAPQTSLLSRGLLQCSTYPGPPLLSVLALPFSCSFTCRSNPPLCSSVRPFPHRLKKYTKELSGTELTWLGLKSILFSLSFCLSAALSHSNTLTCKQAADRSMLSHTRTVMELQLSWKFCGKDLTGSHTSFLGFVRVKTRINWSWCCEFWITATFMAVKWEQRQEHFNLPLSCLNL